MTWVDEENLWLLHHDSKVENGMRQRLREPIFQSLRFLESAIFLVLNFPATFAAMSAELRYQNTSDFFHKNEKRKYFFIFLTR